MGGDETKLKGNLLSARDKAGGEGLGGYCKLTLDGIGMNRFEVALFLVAGHSVAAPTRYEPTPTNNPGAGGSYSRPIDSSTNPPAPSPSDPLWATINSPSNVNWATVDNADKQAPPPLWNGAAHGVSQPAANDIFWAVPKDANGQPKPNDIFWAVPKDANGQPKANDIYWAVPKDANGQPRANDIFWAVPKDNYGQPGANNGGSMNNGNNMGSLDNRGSMNNGNNGGSWNGGNNGGSMNNGNNGGSWNNGGYMNNGNNGGSWNNGHSEGSMTGGSSGGSMNNGGAWSPPATQGANTAYTPSTSTSGAETLSSSGSQLPTPTSEAGSSKASDSYPSLPESEEMSDSQSSAPTAEPSGKGEEDMTNEEGWYDDSDEGEGEEGSKYGDATTATDAKQPVDDALNLNKPFKGIKASPGQLSGDLTTPSADKPPAMDLEAPTKLPSSQPGG
ncbi:hypothetical protein DSO57_1032732 [Entomophthora muscae]|uniref:Uncharacterized protein n=1 Tax=Entomophthora muscae TaxID=34485 RepID=A0ACC2S2H3_9FUNG|nr:hypothetical protein DSO57_1032732 [Entomophthora muscae]